ncbi:MAG TPA: ATPase, T2SS/T4P/T4SS family [Synergistales bacterium]|nr:ATPase, T2SS/T4P/T4SS family [Synergistales bacterium]
MADTRRMAQLVERIESILGSGEVTDIHLTADERIWVRSTRGEMARLAGPGQGCRPSGETLDELHGALSGVDRPDYIAVFPSGKRVRVRRTYSLGRSQLFIRAFFNEIPSVKDLGIDGFFREAFTIRPGIIWICGPVGSGKTTLLASLLSWYVQNEPRHIVTIEDPVEYVLGEGMGIVSQRQLGDDVESFALGVRNSLREDPDIIMIGEVRDPDTVSAALSAAETGHLVLATIHAPNVAGIMERAIGMFPPGDRQDKCIRLSQTFFGAVALRLANSEKGRVWLHEVAWGDPAIRNHIREGKPHQIPSSIEMRKDAGMHTLLQNIKEAVKKGRITEDEAKKHMLLGDSL